MSNFDLSVKSMPSYTPSRRNFGAGGRTGKQRLQVAVNVALIAAAFLFVTAAVLGIFP